MGFFKYNITSILIASAIVLSCNTTSADYIFDGNVFMDYYEEADGDINCDTITASTATFGTSQIFIPQKDAYGRYMILNYMPDSGLALGASTGDGVGSGNVTSEGILVYGKDVLDSAMSHTNWGYARIKQDRFGLWTSTGGSSGFYFFEIDGSENKCFWTDNDNTETIGFDRILGTATFNGVIVDTATVSNHFLSGGVTATTWDYSSDCDGQWKFNDNAANTNVLDYSGNKSTSTFERNTNLVSTTTAKVDRAFNYNGSTDYSSFTDSGNLYNYTGDHTIIEWIKTSVTGTSKSLFFRASGASGYHFIIHTTNQLGYYNAQSGWVYSTATVTDGSWHQVVIVVDVDWGITYYIDGAIDKEHQDTTCAPTSLNNGTVKFGYGQSGWAYSGIMDDVEVYGCALTQAQISTLYKERNTNGIEDLTGETEIQAIGTTATLTTTYADDLGQDVLYVEKDIEAGDDIVAGDDVIIRDDLKVYDDVEILSDVDVVGSLTFDTNIYGAQGIYHSGDTDTYFYFDPDKITVNAGNVKLMEYIEGTSDYVRVYVGLVIPSGTTPLPAVEGAMFLDTDASANGTLMMYSNGAWRAVQALP